MTRTAAQFILNDTVESNEWCLDKGLYETYMRKTQRVLEGQRRLCVDVATILSLAPGQGNLEQHIKQIEDAAQRNWYAAVYIENVQEARLRAWFQARGYLLRPISPDQDQVAPCFYKLLPES